MFHDPRYSAVQALPLPCLLNVIEELVAQEPVKVNEASAGDSTQSPTEPEDEAAPSSDSANTTKGPDDQVTASVDSATSTNTTPKPPIFAKFPPEIHLKIFDILCPVNSTCLGLTCKTFYKIHRRYHGKVSLMKRSDDGHAGGRRLGSRIREFFDPCLHFNKKEVYKYVTQERAEELREQRWGGINVVDTKGMSWYQRAKYLKGFQSDGSDDEV